MAKIQANITPKSGKPLHKDKINTIFIINISNYTRPRFHTSITMTEDNNKTLNHLLDSVNQNKSDKEACPKVLRCNIQECGKFFTEKSDFLRHLSCHLSQFQNCPFEGLKIGQQGGDDCEALRCQTVFKTLCQLKQYIKTAYCTQNKECLMSSNDSNTQKCTVPEKKTKCKQEEEETIMKLAIAENQILKKKVENIQKKLTFCNKQLNICKNLLE